MLLPISVVTTPVSCTVSQI